MRLLAGALLLAAGAASAQPPALRAERCDAAKVRSLIGKARSPMIEARARRLAGAALVRWVPNGAVVTMDFRPERLNLYLDRRGRIARVRCG